MRLAGVLLVVLLLATVPARAHPKDVYACAAPDVCAAAGAGAYGDGACDAPREAHVGYTHAWVAGVGAGARETCYRDAMRDEAAREYEARAGGVAGIAWTWDSSDGAETCDTTADAAGATRDLGCPAGRPPYLAWGVLVP